MQNKQTRVDGTSNLHIDIVDVIDSFVESRVGIEVLTELHTDALQVLLQTITREVFCAIEAHVLEEVSQSALVIIFLYGTYALGDVEIATLLGPLIMANVIRKAVLQFTHLDGWVKRNRRHLHLLCFGCKHHNKHQQQRNQFFHFLIYVF